ncbi:hypothetical protein COCNU_scaffold000388G000020 [Cocos nucifera]|nr:hypothetical protein [Cocos nucifera]
MAVASPSLTLPIEVTAPVPPEHGEVAEKKKKKAISKKLRRKVGHSSGENSGQKQASLDDQEVIHSLMKSSILPYIIDKMIQMENVERFDKSFIAYLKLGHYLFAHSKVVNLCQAKASRAL